MLSSIILATFLVSLSSLVGGLLLTNQKLLTKKLITFLISFAAGVILTIAFLDLLPEALHHAEESGSEINIFVPAFLGVLLFFFLERFLLWFHHHDDSHETEPTSVLILLGDGVHNFIDGIIIAAAFIAEPALGFVTAFAIAAHEVPHEIADFSILIHSGMNKMKALFFNFLSSLTALAGAIGGYYFLQTIEKALPYLLAFSAGTFIYIACSDLIPDLHKEFKMKKRWEQSLPFIAGIILMYFILSLTHGE